MAHECPLGLKCPLKAIGVMLGSMAAFEEVKAKQRHHVLQEMMVVMASLVLAGFVVLGWVLF